MKEIRVGRHVALVDDEDAPLLERYTWHARRADQASERYYAYATICAAGRRNNVLMHRMIMGAQPGQYVDHIDSNGLNNQRNNLRFATLSQNAAHSRRSTGRAGFRGVRSSGRIGKPYVAVIEAFGRQRKLGHFATPQEAARAYDAVAREIYGEFAVVNFPDAHLERL